MNQTAKTDLFLELHVPDFETTIKFYRKLGFEVVWQEDPPAGYLVMQRGESIINFYGGSEAVSQQEYFKKFSAETPRGYGAEVILMVEDIDSYYRELEQKINSIVEPLQNRPWGRKDFRITDPFGFYLRITEKYNWIDKYS